MDILRKLFFKEQESAVMELDEMSEHELIQQIHNEFDTAPQRLFEEAERILAEPMIMKEKVFDAALKQKAARLARLGFTNTKEAAQVAELELMNRKIDQDNEAEILNRQKLRTMGEKVKHYQEAYPFSKFLTVQELERICGKYGLIFAPVFAYIGDVPDKNLKEIENAQDLYIKDLPEGYFRSRFWSSPVTVSHILEHLKPVSGFQGRKLADLLALINLNKNNDVVSDAYAAAMLSSETIRRPGIASSPWLVSPSERFYMASMGDIGWPSGAGSSSFEVSEKAGFHIAAPAKSFDTSRLQKVSEFEYREPVVQKDPIVFRYVKDGILVDSKWGLEASDPALLNPVNN